MNEHCRARADDVRITYRPNHLPTTGRNPPTPFFPHPPDSADLYPPFTHIRGPHLYPPLTSLTSFPTSHPTYPAATTPTLPIPEYHRPFDTGDVFDILYSPDEPEWDPGSVPCFFGYSSTDRKAGEVDDGFLGRFCRLTLVARP